MEGKDTRFPPLSARMLEAALMVTEGNSVADIGCDHGYVPIYLCLSGIARNAVASDVNEGPLSRAMENINCYACGGKVEARLSDGLKGYSASELETVIMLGMGGNLIIRILDDEREKAASCRELILSPQSDLRKVREYLDKNGFRITDEKLVVDDGKYYPVIRAVPGSSEGLSEAELIYGPRLLEKRDRTLCKYLLIRISRLTAVFNGLTGQKGEKARQRCLEIYRELKITGEALKRYED